MPAPDPAIANFAETILRMTRSEGPMLWAVGKLRVPVQSGTSKAGLVYVQDVLDTDLAIGRSDWCGPFISQFQSASVNGRRALVLFVNAQPLLLCTIGD